MNPSRFAALFSAAMFILILTGTARPSGEQFKTFDDGNVTFEYPSDWQAVNGDRILQMKDQMNEKLKKVKRKIIDLQMFIAPKEEAAFFISKTQTNKPITPQALLTERQNVLKKAINSGMLTKVNTLEISKSNAGPVVVEDVDQKDNHRSRAMKIVVGSVIYDFRVAVSQESSYEKYRAYLDHIAATLKKVKSPKKR